MVNYRWDEFTKEDLQELISEHGGVKPMFEDYEIYSALIYDNSFDITVDGEEFSINRCYTVNIDGFEDFCSERGLRPEDYPGREFDFNFPYLDEFARYEQKLLKQDALDALPTVAEREYQQIELAFQRIQEERGRLSLK